MKIQCPDFSYVRYWSMVGLPMLNLELSAKCAFTMWCGLWGIEVVNE